MSVKIRLSRIGKKHVPFYRLIVVDSRKKRDGAFLANIGTYDGLKGTVIRFDETLYGEWVAKGAQVTGSAEKIYKQFKKVGIGVSKNITVQPNSKEKVSVKKEKTVEVEEKKAVLTKEKSEKTNEKK